MSVLFFVDDSDLPVALDCDHVIAIVTHNEGSLVVLSTGHEFSINIDTEDLIEAFKEVLLGD